MCNGDNEPFLYDDDMLSIITIDGVVEELFIADGCDVTKYGDMIHEDMINRMKKCYNREGAWIFRFSKDIESAYVE